MWQIEFTTKAAKEVKLLDKPIRTRIKKAIEEKLLKNPSQHLIPLTGDMLGLYKFRVGDHRILCEKKENKFIILVVKVKHRKNVYN